MNSALSYPLIKTDRLVNQDTSSQVLYNEKVEALVFSCVDYRLTDDVVHLLEKEGLNGKYDLLSIPGSSLSATNDLFPSWRDTFWSSFVILKNLHKFSRVILIDHRNCGAYKVVYGRDLSIDRDEERMLHIVHSQKLRQQIEAKYPDLMVETWLLDLDGTVEKTSIN